MDGNKNNKKITIKKEDYKRFQECAKKTWILANIGNVRYTNELLKQEQISCFFDIQDNQNGSKVDDADFTGINEKTFLQLQETLWPDDVKIDVYHQDDHYPGETIADGNEVGEKAQQYFERNYNCVNLEIYERSLAFEKTKLNLEDKTIEVLFEPSFSYGECVTKCDILKRNGDGWDLIEVKATTSAKKEHFYDVFYQYYILVNCGINVKNVYLMHLNSQYCREGELDFDQLFIINDEYHINTGDKVEKIMTSINQEIKKNIISFHLQRIKTVLSLKSEKVLPWLLKNQCYNDNKEKYCCHVYNTLPEKYTIFNLYRMRKAKKAELFYEKNMLSLLEISHQELRELFSKNNNIIRQIEVTQGLTNEINLTKKKNILEVLDKYHYPIYMYDFETMKSAVPKFDYSSSYQQIPFQYSVHILKDKGFDYQTPSTMEHYSYLSDGEEDPREQLALKLANDLFTNGKGVYVAYYKSFECSRLEELAKYLEHKSKLLTLDETKRLRYGKAIENLRYVKYHTIDLMDFFKDFQIYKKEFNGSLSIKKTLPAFNQDFTYQGMKIAKGDMASEVFRRRVENNITLENWTAYYRQAMIDYCNQDTLAMVVLFQEIINALVKNNIIEVADKFNKTVGKASDTKITLKFSQLQKKYKLLFLGTPTFATSVLKAIFQLKEIELVGIVAQPDRKVGRKQEIEFSPVKKFALEHNIPLYQPIKIIELKEQVQKLQVDILLTCAYGQFIPMQILTLAKINCLNVHASLLPKLRGGAPIHKAIIYGEKETGISLMQMIRQMDAGDVYYQEKIAISNEDTYDSLHNKLANLAFKVCKEKLLEAITAKLTAVKQNDNLVTFAYNITRDEEKIDWNQTSEQIDQQVRGLYSSPGTYTSFNNKIFKVHKCSIEHLWTLNDEQTRFKNGTILDINRQGIIVKVANGVIVINIIQPAGKKNFDVRANYKNLSFLKINDIFN